MSNSIKLFKCLHHGREQNKKKLERYSGASQVEDKTRKRFQCSKNFANFLSCRKIKIHGMKKKTQKFQLFFVQRKSKVLQQKKLLR